jgi:hypothetical protein
MACIWPMYLPDTKLYIIVSFFDQNQVDKLIK